MSDISGAEDIPDVVRPRLSDVARIENRSAPRSSSRLSDVAREGPPRSRQPGSLERATTTAQGFNKGVVEGGTTLAGALGGVGVGMALGSPAGPPGMVVGGILGGLGGGFAGARAGEQLNENISAITIPGQFGGQLTFDNIESVPPRLRPYALGGQSMGESLSFLAFPYIALREGAIKWTPDIARRVFSGVIEAAGKAPGTFAAAEASMALSAGVFRGQAENVRPGEVGFGMGAEVVGGVTNPGGLIAKFYNRGVGTVRRLLASHSPRMQESDAAGIIQKIMQDHGEDPAALANALRQAKTDFPEMFPTSAQAVPSQALSGIEQSLSDSSNEFGIQVGQRAKDSMEALTGLIRVLENVGDPASLRAAAELQEQYFETILSSFAQVASQRVAEAAAKFTHGTDSPAALGKAMREIMNESMSVVRKEESRLWGSIDQDVPGEATSIISRFDSLTAERLPEEPLPGIVRGFVSRAQEEQITSGGLQRFRSRMLAHARDAAANNKWDDARVFGELAESALEDLGRILPDDSGFNEARAFSRQLNEAFGQTFAGDSMGRKSSGGARIPPELLMERAFGAGRGAGDLRFTQMEEAARLAGQDFVARTLDVQEQTIRLAASNLVDPTTGRITESRVAKFRANNQGLLKRFPEIDKELSDVQSAENFFRITDEGIKEARGTLRTAAFAQVLKNEDPVIAVERALRGSNPQQALKDLVKLASTAGEDGRKGLQAALYSRAERAATGNGRRAFSFKDYRQSFDLPITTGGPTVRQLMLDSGLVTKSEMDVLDRFLTRGQEIEAALKGGQQLDDLMGDGDAMLDFTLRIAGARAAAALPTGGASTLIVGGAGSRFARQVFDKTPQRKLRLLLQEAALNPELMATLLTKPATNAEKIAIAQQLNAFLWQIGITGADERRGDAPSVSFEEGDFEPEAQPVRPTP